MGNLLHNRNDVPNTIILSKNLVNFFNGDMVYAYFILCVLFLVNVNMFSNYLIFFFSLLSTYILFPFLLYAVLDGNLRTFI